MVLLLRSLGRLPLASLYGFARFMYFVTFHLLRWRRDLAERNIARSFPDRSDDERAAILRQSYRNMSEVFVELLWGWRASADALKSRIAVENPELVAPFFAEGRSVILLTAHVCNWEWLLPGGGAHFGIPIDAVYKPIRVPSLDAYMREARSRFGGKPIPIKSFAFELMRRAGEPRAYGLVADQTPPKNMAKHWTRFLNQDTAFFVGAEKIARFLEAPVVYVAMRRIDRGRYAVRLHLLAEPPYDGAGFESGDENTWITEAYARKLEQEIRASPADWLWVHNKWKYPKPL
ncbi:MAG TPA: lysophospholipid acyltransferase family protein [Casimicrobiaceae bacterium]|nr:lysophospholipid acyltransferase family protein [Casimicrobiaceae bacterium]